jgi:radical SAM superfamily enzyme YgiQ (UPF0313 family)
MKTLLLIPPLLEVNVVRDVLYGCWCKGKRIGGATVPPLVLLSVATVLKKDGNEVRLLDAPAEKKSLDDVKKIVEEFDVVLMLTSSMTFNEDTQVLEELKKVKKDLTTIVFGSHPTYMPEFCLKRESIDLVVRKEPECIIRDLLRGLSKKDGSWKNVPGIGYRDNGRSRINKDYPFIEDLDELPIYDRSLLPKGVEYYNPIVQRYPYTTSETSRGCPGRCSFCTAPDMYGGKLRFWSSGKVLEEIRILLKQGYKEIYYRDETFTTFKKRNVEIFKNILKEKMDVSWLCNVRVGTVDKDTLALMKKAGCHTIKIGLESGVQEILDKSNKGIKVSETKRLFAWAKACGLNTHAHIMLGMPGENKNTVRKTINFTKEVNPTTIDVGICTPYPGTKLFNELVKAHPEIDKDYVISLEKLHTESAYNECFTELNKEELEKSLSQFYKEFYMRPSHALSNIAQIKNFNDFKRIFRASLNLLKFVVNKAKD